MTVSLTRFDAPDQDSPAPSPEPHAGDSGAYGRFLAVAQAAADADGYDPFNEQTRLDVHSHTRQPLLVTVGDEVVGAAVTGGGELDLVVHPAHRRRGHGAVALNALLESAPGELTAWSHGDHAGARALASTHGFTAVRTLLRLRRDPLDAPEPPDTDLLLRAFTERDIEAWVRLNARVFASHPEQGAVTADDVRARMAEPWFDAEDFLLALDGGRLVGYNWLKREPGSPDGEIYVIGVDADHAGHGVGRTLLRAGLARLAEAGCRAAVLYVEADNEPALGLYRSLGFADDLIDVQYRRTV